MATGTNPQKTGTAMLERIERQWIQTVKEAESLKVSIKTQDTELELAFSNRGGRIKKLRYEIAIAIQEYFNNKNNLLRQ